MATWMQRKLGRRRKGLSKGSKETFLSSWFMAVNKGRATWYGEGEGGGGSRALSLRISRTRDFKTNQDSFIEIQILRGCIYSLWDQYSWTKIHSTRNINRCPISACIRGHLGEDECCPSVEGELEKMTFPKTRWPLFHRNWNECIPLYERNLLPS